MLDTVDLIEQKGIGLKISNNLKMNLDSQINLINHLKDNYIIHPCSPVWLFIPVGMRRGDMFPCFEWAAGSLPPTLVLCFTVLFAMLLFVPTFDFEAGFILLLLGGPTTIERERVHIILWIWKRVWNRTLASKVLRHHKSTQIHE